MAVLNKRETCAKNYCYSIFIRLNLIKQNTPPYCVKFRTKAEKLNSKIFKTKQGRLIMQSKCSACGIKKSRFVKEQKAKGLLSILGIKTPFSKISLLNVLFKVYKMNEIVNKFFLADDKSVPEMNLKQPGFTYSPCSPSTKNKERTEKFLQTGNADFIYRNELDKACFQHDMVYKFFDQKSSDGAIKAKPNYQITNELHRQIIRKFKRRKVYSSFRDNIWGVDLADMRSLSKYNKGIK